MVLHNPLASLGIVVCKEGHTNIRTIDIGQRAADTYDTTPCASTNNRTQVVSLEAPGEQVAIRCRILVNQKHLRTVVCSVGNCSVALTTTIHSHTISLTQQTLDNHRRYVTTTVSTIVDNQRLLIQLRIEITSKLVETLGAHIGDVDIAHLAVGSLRHLADILLYPVVVVERILVSDGAYNNLACTSSRCGAIYAELGQDVSLAYKQLIDILYARCRHTVNSYDIVTLLNAYAGLCQRRAQCLAIYATGQNLLDAEETTLIALKLGAQQTHRNTLQGGNLTGIYVCVTATYLRDHLADDVVQIKTSLGIGNKYLILLLNGLPVDTVHILQVETITESTPYLIIDLCPLLHIIDVSNHILRADGILQISLGCGEVGNEHLTTSCEESLLAAGSYRERCIGNGLLLLCLQIEGLRTTCSSVIDLLAIREEVTV